MKSIVVICFVKVGCSVRKLDVRSFKVEFVVVMMWVFMFMFEKNKNIFVSGISNESVMFFNYISNNLCCYVKW